MSAVVCVGVDEMTSLGPF